MTVTRPARLTGAAFCAALVLISAVWILRDLAALGSPLALVRYWTGDHALLLGGRSSTSLVEPLLLLATVATAVAALRSRHAASALAATGAVTLALRLPGLWATGTGALVSTLLQLALATGLVVTAVAGRRPPRSAREPLPTRPRTGPAATAGALLVTAAAVGALWEAYWATELPLEITVDRFTGGRSVARPALGVPPGWLAAVLAALHLTAGISALARARHTRAFGLLAGGLLTGGGLAQVVLLIRYETLPGFADLTTTGTLSALSSLFALFAGLAVLALLAGRGVPEPVPAGAPYPPAGAPPPAPPFPRPPGW
ncbi:hypothetical protein [Streptomyces sp. NPDC126503]|uniref:hypothetical protein n=1 Tax=Streptomyces sp. NPDC126503 TaxID=3155315 RepID=UPI00332A63A1